jgi:hypothetical protein
MRVVISLLIAAIVFLVGYGGIGIFPGHWRN